MKQYRIITQGGKHFVQEGETVPAFFYGDPPVEWHTLQSFYTMVEAQNFISFMQSSKSGDIYKLDRYAI